MSVLHDDARRDAFDFTSHFRGDHACLTRRGDTLFELTDAMLCENGPVAGWPYSFVAALETGRTSWCQLLDAVRLGPDDDVAEVTAVQVRRVVADLIAGGQWEPGDPDVLVVFDAGYDAPRMAYLLDGLPVEVLGRMRTDRVMRRPAPTLKEYAATYPQGGRPPKHGKEFRFAKADTWGAPDAATVQVTERYGTAKAIWMLVVRRRSAACSCRAFAAAAAPASG